MKRKREWRPCYSAASQTGACVDNNSRERHDRCGGDVREGGEARRADRRGHRGGGRRGRRRNAALANVDERGPAMPCLPNPCPMVIDVIRGH